MFIIVAAILVEDIALLERVQRRVTKFILSDYTSNYKDRLIQLGMLPLMYIYELADIMFFIKSIKHPTDKFNILNYVSFHTGPATRSVGTKLNHMTATTNSIINSYFYRLPRLWNSLPIIDLTRPPTETKLKLKRYLWNHFLTYFDSNTLCSFHYLCPCTHCAKTPALNNYNPLWLLPFCFVFIIIISI